jgi:hypothetical protein
MNQDSQSHRAAPELWAAAEKFGQNSMDMLNCLLELRSRIEALEREAAMAELPAASAEVRPAGGLVERVAMAANCYPHENARAAIREVAKWLRDRYPKSPEAGAVAFNLCQESDRG